MQVFSPLIIIVIFLSFSVAAYEPFIETGVLDDGSSAMLRMKGLTRSSSISDTAITLKQKTNLVEAYIVGGTEAKQGDYPWIVKSVEGFGVCTATLIHSDMVLTAAHCQGKTTAVVICTLTRIQTRYASYAYRVEFFSFLFSLG